MLASPLAPLDALLASSPVLPVVAVAPRIAAAHNEVVRNDRNAAAHNALVAAHTVVVAAAAVARTVVAAHSIDGDAFG